MSGLDREWPDCIRCGSGETVVVPKTGEWTCKDCGCQWTAEETPTEAGDADQIPDDIERLVTALVQAAESDTEQEHL